MRIDQNLSAADENGRSAAIMGLRWRQMPLLLLLFNALNLTLLIYLASVKNAHRIKLNNNLALVKEWYVGDFKKVQPSALLHFVFFFLQQQALLLSYSCSS